MKTTTDLKSLYREATCRKLAIFRPFFISITLAFIAIVAINLIFNFNHKSYIIAGCFITYALGSTIVAVMAFFNDTYFDICESIKDVGKS